MESSKKQISLICVIIVLALIFYLALRFIGETGESSIRKAVYAGVIGFERKDISKCSALISEGYSDQYGNSKASLLDIVKEAFEKYNDARVVIKQLQIQLIGETATADIGVVIYFKKVGLPKTYYSKFKLKAGFVKDGKRWILKSVEYSDAKDTLYVQTVA